MLNENVDALHSWQGEQQSKTEGFKNPQDMALKKAAGPLSWWNTVECIPLQWNDDILSGRGIQILEGQSSGGEENQAPGKQD